MDGPLVTLASSPTRTRLLVTVGPDEVLRATLPRLDRIPNERAVRVLLEGLSLWLDRRLCVALSAAGSESYFRLDLTDELGVGVRGLYYTVDVVETRQQRGARIRGMGDFRALRHLALLADLQRVS